MDRHDEELLAKQMRSVAPPRNDGIVGLMVAAMFLVGFVLGGSFFAAKPSARVSQDVATYSSVAPTTFQR
ncbi:MAG TPA: hypothetical protein VFW22_14505 [Pseudolabrys sp.]|nr:hypothetical protein [Pseudolabrys sp.]